MLTTKETITKTGSGANYVVETVAKDIDGNDVVLKRETTPFNRADVMKRIGGVNKAIVKKQQEVDQLQSELTAAQNELTKLQATLNKWEAAQ